MTVADALLAIASSDQPKAIGALRGVLDRNPTDLLAAGLVRYLNTSANQGVYQEPSSFQEFIDNGTNPNLYAATIDRLRLIHQVDKPASILDIGCGDGRVTTAVVGPSTQTVHLVEPSQELLFQAEDQEGWPLGIQVQGHLATLAAYLGTIETKTSFSLVQSTFAMHTTLPEQRSELLSKLAAHTDHVVMVDFDVPAFASRSPEHAAYTAERYRQGVAEYIDHPAVIDGFLIPVLVAQFDPNQKPMTFEQPANAWVAGFERAGFDTTISTIYDYWWAPAFLLDARVRS